MRLPIFLRQSDSSVTSCILILKFIGRSGFWCAGFIALPTKKLISVASSKSRRQISEAPSF